MEKRHRIPSCYINVNRIINAIKDCFLFFLDLIQNVFLHYVFDKIFVNRCSAQVSDWSYANCFNNKVSKGSILSRFASVKSNCENLESRKFLLVESGIRGFEIRSSAQGIRNPTYNLNRESKFHWQRMWNLVPGIWNLESTAWNPGSKTVLYYLTWSEILLH